jgi:hypothetical protein
MFSTKNKTAIEFYKQACSAEEKGEMELAELYYLKSAYAFEETGNADYLNAANAFNALAFLRESRGNHKGALCAAKKSAQIMENYREQPTIYDAELIRMTAWELINDLISFEIESRTLISQAG